MIYLTKHQTSSVILTLKEKQTLAAPNYLFYFVNRTSNEVVKFVKLNNADISTHKDRYNKFSIDAQHEIHNKLAGEWTYYIYEQTSQHNTNPAQATSLLETGILRLDDNSNFAFTEYDTDNTFKVRE
jgi:hypothetical protein